VQDSGYNLMSQTPETFEDTRELNQTLNQWNNLQDRLSEGGFTTAALKPKQEERLQEKLAETEQRFQDLYWNVRDELSYLEPMRRQLAEVLQKQAGSLPSVTLSSNLVAQAENYAQQFKAQKGDLDGLEELKILYSELQTYLWVTQLFIEQDSPNQEVVEALRKLKGQIVKHSEYLAEKSVFFTLPSQVEIEAIEQKIDTLIQEIDAIFPSGEFSVQQTGDPFAHLKTEFASLKNKLNEYKNLKEVPYSTRVQRVLEMSEQVKPLLKKAGEYIRFTLKLGRSIPPIGPVGLAVKTISLLLDIQELLDACQKLDNSEKLSELNQSLKKATQETEIALRRATSAECREVDAPLDTLESSRK
jgi:hypothetical protein